MKIFTYLYAPRIKCNHTGHAWAPRGGSRKGETPPQSNTLRDYEEFPAGRQGRVLDHTPVWVDVNSSSST